MNDQVLQTNDQVLQVRVLGLIASGDIKKAAVMALYGDGENDGQDGHGHHIYAWLRGVMKDDHDADEVFNEFFLAVFEDIGSYRGDGPLKSWLYRVARNTAHTFWRNRNQRREVPLGVDDEVIQKARTSTKEWKKSTVKDAFQLLRLELSEEEQTLLILRVDRDMDWEDVARVFIDVNESTPSDALPKEVNRLKQQFSRVKKKLKKLAIERKLLPQEG